MIKRSPPSTDKKKGKAKRVVAVTERPKQRVPLPPARPGRAPAPTPPARKREVPEEREAGTWVLTLEAALYMVAGLFAFAVRLYALGRLPLQEGESLRAWAAWSYYRALPDAGLMGQSPLLIFANIPMFLLFGASDATARFLPALAGGLCAVLPYALRRDMGRVGALVAAFMLALSPTLTFVSRSVDGGAIVCAGALALVAGSLAYLRWRAKRYVYFLAAVLGVMFAADRTAGPTAVILAVFAVIVWWRSGQPALVAPQTLRIAALLFLAAAVLLGTGFLTNLQGVQAALVDPLTGWLVGMGRQGSTNTLSFYSRVLLGYEALAVFGALLGALALGIEALRSRGLALAWPRVRQRVAAEADNDVEDESGADAPEGRSSHDGGVSSASSLSGLFVYWAACALVFYLLLGDRSPASVAQIVLPMILLGAWFVGRALESQSWKDAMGREGWLLTALLILIGFALLAWANPTNIFGGRFVSLEKRIQNVQAVILAVMVLGMAVLAAWYAYRLRLSGTALALGSAVAIVLLVFTVHSTWNLNHYERANATDPLLPQRVAYDVFLLRDDVREVSRRQGDDAMPITIDERLTYPLTWYLRQFLSVSSSRAAATAKTPVVIVPADTREATSKALGQGYGSQRYRLLSTWQEAPVSIERWLRWAVWREPLVTPRTQEIYAFFRLPQ